jgi:predicted transcriptional regulator
LKAYRINACRAKFKVDDYREYVFRTVRRNRLEIVSAIIALARQPSSFTHITSHANPSYSIAKEDLRFMVDSRLICEHDIAKGGREQNINLSGHGKRQQVP